MMIRSDHGRIHSHKSRRPDAKSDRCRLPPSIWTWTVATSPQRRRWRQPTASARTTDRTSAAAISSRARRSAAGSAAAAAAAATTGAWTPAFAPASASTLAPALAPAPAPTGRAPRDVLAVRIDAATVATAAAAAAAAATATAAAVAPAASTLWWCAETIPSRAGTGTNHTAVLASAASMLAATFPCLTAITCAIVTIPHHIIPCINLWL